MRFLRGYGRIRLGPAAWTTRMYLKPRLEVFGKGPVRSAERSAGSTARMVTSEPDEFRGCCGQGPGRGAGRVERRFCRTRRRWPSAVASMGTRSRVTSSFVRPGKDVKWPSAAARAKVTGEGAKHDWWCQAARSDFVRIV